MNSLDLFSEPFSPTGNLASEGALNPLGRPGMDGLEVLVREAVQNCWDAREKRSPQVQVTIGLRSLTKDQKAILTDTAAAEYPSRSDSSPDQIESMLLIADRGTSGLGGPLRADRDDAEEARDFVDFFRNIGQPPDKEFGGGTFGYGKAALYLASRFRTIAAHTRCHWRGQQESRFMMAQLGGQFVGADGQRFTGRHWWGRNNDGVIDPARGEEAEELAAGLKLPGFDSDGRGTTIMIFEPVVGNRTHRQAIAFVAEAVLWHFWPKMLSPGDTPAPMKFTLDVDGEEVVLPHPEEVPPLHGFVQAYRRLKGDGGGSASTIGHAEEVHCLKPQKALGTVALQKFPVQERPHVDLGENGPYPGLSTDRCHHVALLRVPELVIKYYAGPELPNRLVEYAGVFLAHRDVDRVFAKSEPPTHDDWVADSLSDWSEKRYVGSLYRRLRERAEKFVGIRDGDAEPGEGAPLARLANHLAGLLPGWEGPGAGRQPPPGKPNGKPPRRRGAARASLRVTEEPSLEIVDGHKAMTVGFEVARPQGVTSVTVRARPRVIVDSGDAEREAPVGDSVPAVLKWTDSDGNQIASETSELPIGDDRKSQYWVTVSVPEDAYVAVDLTVRSD